MRAPFIRSIHASLPLLSIVAGVCLSAPALRADTITWANTGADFNNPANWNAGAGPVPGPADTAVFTGAATVDPNLTASRALLGMRFDFTSSGYVVSSNPGASILINNGGTLSANIDIQPATISASIADAVLPTSTPGSLTKIGLGTLTLSGVNTYTGVTEVNQGALYINGAHTGGGLIRGLGATIGGNGAVNGRINAVNTSISPGAAADAVGILTVSSAGGTILNLGLNGRYRWELASLKDDSTGTAGVDFDQIVLNGAGSDLVMNPNSTLELGILPGVDRPGTGPFWFSPHTWTIIKTSGVNNPGGFGMVSTSQLPGIYTTSADANGVYLHYTPQGIPEPSSLGLLGLGIATLFRRRKRNP